jgi:hypothetical protein
LVSRRNIDLLELKLMTSPDKLTLMLLSPPNSRLPERSSPRFVPRGMPLRLLAQPQMPQGPLLNKPKPPQQLKQPLLNLLVLLLMQRCNACPCSLPVPLLELQLPAPPVSPRLR